VEFAFVGEGVEPRFAESAEYFFDVFFVGSQVRGVNEDVVEVDDNTDVHHIGKCVVHESLEGCGGVGKSERHD